MTLVSYLVNLMHTLIWTGSRWDISSEVGHDIISLMIAFITRKQIPLCYRCTDIYSDMCVCCMNDSPRMLKPNPRLSFSCYSEQKRPDVAICTHPDRGSASCLSQIPVPCFGFANLRRNSHIPVLSIKPFTLELARENKALVCPDKPLRRCSRGSLDSLSAPRWSWVLPISTRTDYCLTFVNPKTDEAQYFIACCGVTSVGWQSLIRKMPKHINSAVTYSVWGGPYWPEQAGSGEDVGHESATSGGSWIWMNTDANPWDSFRLMGISKATLGSIWGQIW